jgi:BASS family bile acid:Na+ symporter
MNTDLISSVTELSILGVDLAIIGTVALILIMVTTGLTLEGRHFKPVLAAPKAIYFGLMVQLIGLPMVAFALVYWFEPSAYIALGLILLSCCPGGATSNFFTLLAKGNVATSICLTVLSGMVAVFSIPYLLNFALNLYSENTEIIFLPVAESMLRIFVLIVLPVIIGMAINYKFPAFSRHIESTATRVSFVFVLLTMVVILYHIMPIVPDLIKDAGLITLLLNVSMMLFGFLGAKILCLDERNMRCVTIEIGVQNYLLSVVIALTMLQQPLFAIVPLLYLFIMYITVFSFIGYCRFFRHENLSSSTSDISV